MESEEPDKTSKYKKTFVSEANQQPSFVEALKNVELRDLSPKNVASFPCARNSFLLGIASGVTIGLLRLYRTGGYIRSAGNWGFATFGLLSIVSWELCRLQRRKSQEALQTLEIGPMHPQPKFEYDSESKKI